MTSSSPVQSVAQNPYGGRRIYMDFFNLRGSPFSITPDPDFLFLSDTHRSVIEKIHYGIESRMGFMLLVGEVGTGKSTLCRVLLDQLQDNAKTVYLINPSLNGKELIASILDDLGVAWPAKAKKKELIDRLNRFLLSQDHASPVVIIIDDAQTMPPATMEDLRLLSNLETDKHKLLQMLLVGQPELRQLLDRPELRQLKQRITINCFLEFLSKEEVRGYIEQRLFIAGNQGQIRFAPKTITLLHKQSGGVPRMINKICDMALTSAYASGSHVVEISHLQAAYGELIESQSFPISDNWWFDKVPHLRWLLAFGLILGMLFAFGGYNLITAHIDKVSVILKAASQGPTITASGHPPQEIRYEPAK
ncbi:MAG: AAA family ATPase [Desulfobacteraceae bacterium]|jgi:general secretion pathway protein A